MIMTYVYLSRHVHVPSNHYPAGYQPAGNMLPSPESVEFLEGAVGRLDTVFGGLRHQGVTGDPRLIEAEAVSDSK